MEQSQRWVLAINTLVSPPHAVVLDPVRRLVAAFFLARLYRKV
jgi:hypothetical protein